MNKLTNDLQRMRQELLIMDEPIKAYELAKLFGVDDTKSYAMVRHIYDPDMYKKVYGMQGEDRIENYLTIEPDIFILHAEARADRYRWIIEEVEKEKPKTYLDLACYVGSLVTTVASKGVKAYGVDMTKRAVEIARERAKDLDCEFYLDDATTFDKVKADMVSAFEVIEHVVDPEQFVRHLLELSKGWIYVTTPCGAFEWGKGNIGHWEWDGVESHVRGHVRVFTKESMFRLLNKCGCEIGFLEEMPDQLLWCKFRKGGKK